MMQQKLADTQANLNEMIATRWSPRAFDPNKAVNQHDLLTVLEAARWAPSCFNDQPWRFVVCDKSINPSAWRQALETLVEKNQRWAKNAPVLIITVAMTKFNHNAQPNRWAGYDTGAASLNLCLQATALGLSTHQMGGFDPQKVQEQFKLPDDCQPIAVIALGYQTDIDGLDDEFKEAEAAARSRANLSERFYNGTWGEGINLK
jgi:nitroreductase